jgi:hypothetical protein
MVAVLVTPLLAALTHGTIVVPLLWVIGILLLVAGLISLVRGGLFAGFPLIILGILLGGLNVL